MTPVDGILRIKQTKKGREYCAVYTNRKGKSVEPAIQPGARCFHEGDAADGDPLVIELNESQLPAKVTIKGKREAAPLLPKAPVRTAPYGGKRPERPAPMLPRPPATALAARRDATAPYNFIPYDPDRIIDDLPPVQDPLYSGTIRCRLTSLTPLLVSGPQERDQNKRFLELDGKSVIPGSSLKGLLRSLVETLSFSRMAPMNERALMYRNFNDLAYKSLMGAGDNARQKAGWMVKNGADYVIRETECERLLGGKRAPESWIAVTTGNRVKLGTPSTYAFAPLREARKDYPVKRELVALFAERITKHQEDTLRRFGTDARFSKPCPVFFITDDTDTMLFFGLPRYFRLPYAHKPADKAGERHGLDFAARLFGSARSAPGESVRGRVSVGHAVFEDAPLEHPTGFTATLGQPGPTCIAHYLVQPATVGRMPNADHNNDPATMCTYNDEDFHLRGRKFYWHRDFVPEDMPQGNENTNVRLFPIRGGCTASFSLVLDRLGLEELGAVLMALELPEGHAHKLGMGKPLGLGSIRISVEEMDIRPEADRYRSLVARRVPPDGTFAGEQEAVKRAAKDAFRDFVTRKLRCKGENRDFEDLPAIKTLRAMMRFEGRPPNEATRYMELPIKKTGLAGYGNKAILKDPLEVVRSG